ncbi:MAG: hypothetical protein AAF632_14595 [Bacteroidota bacterium]
MKPTINTSQPAKNQQHLNRYYWELHRSIQQTPDQKHRILLRDIQQTDELRKKIKRLYQEAT